MLSLSLIFPLIATFPMYAVLPFIISVNFAKFDLLLISTHLFSLQMLLFHPNLIIVIVFLTSFLIIIALERGLDIPDTSIKRRVVFAEKKGDLPLTGLVDPPLVLLKTSLAGILFISYTAEMLGTSP